jgi:6-phosphogluconate dehydrogenase
MAASTCNEAMKMQPALAMVGLGRMGGGMARRIARAGLGVAGFDAAAGAAAALAGEAGVVVHASLAAAIVALRAPRIVWIMLPAGSVTEAAIGEAAALLEAGDIIVDGGNADWRDSAARGAKLAERGLHFVDVGVSGGIWGLKEGYGLMFGGPDAAVAPLRPVLMALAPAPDRGWVHCGPTGSGHYAKMVHNGIEYGLMQSYAEGFALLAARADLHIDVAAVAEAWRHGTVVRSWLLDLAAGVLKDKPALAAAAPVVADSGEGRWTLREAIELGVPLPTIGAALNARLASQGHADYGSRVLARLRQAFGGHAVQAGPTGPPGD